jgi:hypothetical protein
MRPSASLHLAPADHRREKEREDRDHAYHLGNIRDAPACPFPDKASHGLAVVLH